MWTVLQAGVTFPLLKRPETPLDYVKGNVIPATRKYLTATGAKIHPDKTFVRPKLRLNNKSIIDRVITLDLNATQQDRKQLCMNVPKSHVHQRNM
jgi:hypothetical protein